MKKVMRNKFFALTAAIIAVFSMSLTSAIAESIEQDYQNLNEIIISDEIYVGSVMERNSSNAIVIEVNEDGSFKNMVISSNIYASVCQHPKFVQVTNPKFIRKARASSSTICFYKVYVALYKCIRCGTSRQIETYIPVNHTYKNNRCTVCSRVKK